MPILEERAKAKMSNAKVQMSNQIQGPNVKASDSGFREKARFVIAKSPCGMKQSRFLGLPRRCAPRNDSKSGFSKILVLNFDIHLTFGF
jgi:hypothetical protein